MDRRRFLPTAPGVLAMACLVGASACSDLTGAGEGGSGPPSVRFSSPTAEETGVSVHSTIEIRFSVELDPASVGESVQLLDAGRPVLTTTYLRNGKVVLMEPTDPLDFGTTYRVRVGPGLQSRRGKSTVSEDSWTFRTEGSAVPDLEIDSLRSTLESLAHDSMKGRGSGTVDEARAASFLQERFEAYGLGVPPGGGIQAFETYSERLDRVISSQNILGAVPGTGSLADEWVVVGAHYDHIGMATEANGTISLHNGADDNGSGTVLILEMARIYRDYVESGGLPSEDRRSVLFAAFGSEELGLLGSCHYVEDDPAVPLEQTVAMLNFDMVGRLREDVLLPLGFESWERWSFMLQNSNHSGLVLVDPPGACSSCSDHACFRQADIPFLWFHTGSHDQYHTPADDVDLINFPGMARIGETSLRVLTRLVVLDGTGHG